MSGPEEAEKQSVEFAWGEKRGQAKNKNAQFYGSFTYDGQKYSLYDCVYLFHEDAPEPYIGKIVKIWEQPGQKRGVKILWFFRPTEIHNFLVECEKPLTNEIFLAKGSEKSVGVFDVNRLEAIAGKCNVICTSRDKRNPQPVDEEVKAADYIFYRTFDVESFRISDKIGDGIAGVEAKYVFNRKLFFGNSMEKERSRKNVSIKRSLSSECLEQGADQSVGKNVLGEKAIQKSELALGTNGTKGQPVDAIDNKPSKKIRLTDATKPTEHFQKNGSKIQGNDITFDHIDKKAPEDSMVVPLDKENSKLDAHSVVLDRRSAGKAKLDAASISISSDRSLKKAVHDLTNETVVVGRKPEDASKWFTGLPWEDRMWKAYEQETLVLLENFDIAYTAEEIEDMVFHFFNKKCTARVIEMSTFSKPSFGQAFIICKNNGDADAIIKELKTRVLMFSGRRPLIASRAVPKQPVKSPKFFGHVVIDKMKQQSLREEWRKAVSTSHCAQPNTIEYEMGMDWMLLQEKSMSWWKELHKGHREELRRIMRDNEDKK